MKKNLSLDNRGFLLMETLLVSLTIAGILVYMYVQYSSIGNTYQRFYRYNSLENVYRVETIKKYLIFTSGDSFYSKLDNGEVVELTKDSNVGNLWTNLWNDLKISKVYVIRVNQGITTDQYQALKDKITALDSTFGPFLKTLAPLSVKDAEYTYQVIVRFGYDANQYTFATQHFKKPKVGA